MVPTAGGTFAAGDTCLLAYGIGIVSTDASAVGSTAMPDPAAEEEFPWMQWGEFMFHFDSATLDPASPAQQKRIAIDVRSMRILRPRQTLAWVWQYVNLAGNPPMSVMVPSARVLLGLH